MTRVLVADDSPNVRQLLRVILTPDYHVIEASDGDEALDVLFVQRPPLAILDIGMPGHTGLEVCRAVRNDPRTRETRVLVITANGTPNNHTAALEAGADAFMPKPFSPFELLRTVAALSATLAG